MNPYLFLMLLVVFTRALSMNEEPAWYSYFEPLDLTEVSEGTEYAKTLSWNKPYSSNPDVQKDARRFLERHRLLQFTVSNKFSLYCTQ